MTKRLLLLLLLPPLLVGALAHAQVVTITGQVLDPAGHPYVGGNGRSAMVSRNGSGSVFWTIGGTNPVRTPVVITGLDATGHFSIQLTNTALVDQQTAAPGWQFSFCSFNYPPQVCFTMTPMALTSNQDITAQIQAQSAPLPPSGGGGGATPGGPSFAVQYNAGAGAFGGSSAFTFTPSTSLVQAPYVQAKSYDQERIATDFAGADIGAQVNAAIADCVTNAVTCRIRIPAGCRGGLNAGNCHITSPSNGIVVPDGTWLEGDGTGNTQLIYDPATGAALTFNGSTYGSASSLLIYTTTASSTADCVAIGGGAARTSHVDLNAVQCGREGDALGFGSNLDITGTNLTASGNITINNFVSRSFVGECGIKVNHAVDVNFGTVENYSVNPAQHIFNNWGLCIDSGASGVNLAGNFSNGWSGTIVRNTLGCSGAGCDHGAAPTFIFANGLVNDDGYTDAALKFDASLNTVGGPTGDSYGYKYDFVDTWNRGVNPTNSVGVRWNGGTDITLTSNHIVANACHGIMLDAPDSAVYAGSNRAFNVIGAYFADNQTQHPATGGGCADVHVTAGTSNWSITNSYLYGTSVTACCSGADYGIDIDAGTTDDYTIANNVFDTLHIAEIRNAATGIHWTIAPNILSAKTAGNITDFPVPPASAKQGYYFVDNNNFFGFDASGNPAWCPNGGDCLNFDRAANGGLGQYNIGLNNVQNFHFRPTEFAVDAAATLTAAGPFRLPSLSGCLSVTAGTVGGSGSPCGSGSGSGTVATGAQGQFNEYLGAGTVTSPSNNLSETSTASTGGLTYIGTGLSVFSGQLKAIALGTVPTTVAGLASITSPFASLGVWVTDGVSASDCTVGSSSGFPHNCYYTGSTWIAGGGGTGTVNAGTTGFYGEYLTNTATLSQSTNLSENTTAGTGTLTYAGTGGIATPGGFLSTSLTAGQLTLTKPGIGNALISVATLSTPFGWNLPTADALGVLHSPGGGTPGSPSQLTLSKVAPADVTSAQGNGAKFQLSTGTTTTGDCVQYDANGNATDAGFACGSGGGAAFQVNGTPLTSATTVNFQNSATIGGIVIGFTNPSAGNVKLGLTTGSAQGNGNLLPMGSGSYTTNDLLSVDASGNFVDSGVLKTAITSVSSLTAAGATNTILNGNFPQLWKCALSTAATDCMTFSESTAGTAGSTAHVLRIGTLVTSSVRPLIVTAQGTANGIEVGATGILAAIGSGHVNADQANGSAFAASATTDTTVASNISSGTLTNARLATDIVTTPCSINSDGTGTLGALQATDNRVAQCKNDFGATLTVTKVSCWGDASDTLTVQIATASNGISSGTNLLSSACTPGNQSWTNCTLSGTPTIINGNSLYSTITVGGGTLTKAYCQVVATKP